MDHPRGAILEGEGGLVVLLGVGVVEVGDRCRVALSNGSHDAVPMQKTKSRTTRLVELGVSKTQRPYYSPQIVGLLLYGHPRRGPPIYEQPIGDTPVLYVQKGLHSRP